MLSTIFWSVLSASLHSGNADQLINVYLFENTRTFDAAAYPGTHSFLLKWPLFLLIKFLGSSSIAFSLFTVLFCLLTVGALALVLYRIERRPWVFGAICLALASVLILVPAQPYPGALLPANMAMLTTRNLEYIIYIAVLCLLIKSSATKQRYFWLATVLLGLLIASDKLFFSLSFGGALIALAASLLIKSWSMIGFYARWLVLSLIGLGFAQLILSLYRIPGLPGVVSSSSLSPFGLVHSFHQFVLATIYAFLAVLTNFGANPAFVTTLLRNVPHEVGARLSSFSGLAYLINLAILAASIYFVSHLVALTLKNKTKPDTSSALSLSLMLIWSAVAVLLIYLLSNHYYAADARYLNIMIFGLFIASTVYLRRLELKPKTIAFIYPLLGIGIALGLVASINNYHAEQKAVAELKKRNSIVAQVVLQHPVDALVGDYWRVVPIRLQSDNQLHILPHMQCLAVSKTLSSNAWNLDLSKHSFAYLLTRDRGPTDYKNCSLDQVVQAYGRPNSSTLIAGSFDNPLEQVLFYDKGINNHPVKAISQPPSPISTVMPITLAQIPHQDCSSERTVMNIVAHQDDDLLFFNPDTFHDLAAGNCVRTVYLTAGDAGLNQLYWTGREKGSEASYNSMLNYNYTWINRIVKLDDNKFVTIATPRGLPGVSLIFMRLPDGNLTGTGFNNTNKQSLAKLESNKINSIQTVDNQSTYTTQQLIKILSELMAFYKPAELRTQSGTMSKNYPDHSDHTVTGRLSQKAYQTYLKAASKTTADLPIKFYVGYPVRDRPANVSEPDLKIKSATFLAYAQFDQSVCQAKDICLHTPTYNAYLHRQYTSPY